MELTSVYDSVLFHKGILVTLFVKHGSNIPSHNCCNKNYFCFWNTNILFMTKIELLSHSTTIGLKEVDVMQMQTFS